jgi:uncharacterized protein
MKKVVLFLLVTYRKFISPVLEFLFGRACRFKPDCSVYSYQAVEKHGVIKGGLMAAKRIIRCNPLSKGGWDPVQ